MPIPETLSKPVSVEHVPGSSLIKLMAQLVQTSIVVLPGYSGGGSGIAWSVVVVVVAGYCLEFEYIRTSFSRFRWWNLAGNMDWVHIPLCTQGCIKNTW